MKQSTVPTPARSSSKLTVRVVPAWATFAHEGSSRLGGAGAGGEGTGEGRAHACGGWRFASGSRTRSVDPCLPRPVFPLLLVLSLPPCAARVKPSSKPPSRVGNNNASVTPEHLSHRIGRMDAAMLSSWGRKTEDAVTWVLWLGFRCPTSPNKCNGSFASMHAAARARATTSLI